MLQRARGDPTLHWYPGGGREAEGRPGEGVEVKVAHGHEPGAELAVAGAEMAWHGTTGRGGLKMPQAWKHIHGAQ